jgi:hypothetical protein
VPCPNCGSKNRHYSITLGTAVELNVAMSVTALKSKQLGPAVEARVERAASVGAALEDAGFSVTWLRLSDGGAWMVRVLDRKDEFIDGAMADDPQEAILAVAERLLPPS